MAKPVRYPARLRKTLSDMEASRVRKAKAELERQQREERLRASPPSPRASAATWEMVSAILGLSVARMLTRGHRPTPRRDPEAGGIDGE